MLTAVGLAVLWGRGKLAGRATGPAARTVQRLPVLGAVATIVGGLWLAALAAGSL